MRLNRRLLLLGAGILAVAVLAGRLAAPCRAAEPTPPNIIFLLTDDQRWDTLGCMGNAIVQTPNIDRLAEGGMVFDNCFVTTSICMTNRACIFTGQYAARHGIIRFRVDFTPEQLAQTYPALLKRAGYHIGFIGKWGVGNPPEDLFDYNRGWPGQNSYLRRQPGKDVLGYLDPPARRSVDPEDVDQEHLTARMGRQALEFLDGAPRDRPFCLSFSFKAPHCQDGQPAYRQFPYDPRLESLYQDVTIPPARLSEPEFFDALPEFLKMSENRVRWQIRFADEPMYQHSVKSYYRLISGVDRVVGRLVRKLEQLGRDRNTVIVYTGDNGFYLGERGLAGKWLAHEVSLRVPLVVYDPRAPREHRGRRCNQTVLSIDLAPTMLAMGGVAIPEGMQGESLVPMLKGEDPPWRTEFFYEHLFANARIPRNEAVRDARHKYIRYLDVEPPGEELYDLTADPDEADNLAAQPEHAAALERMREKWQAWRQRVK
ncbi:MAG: sulfatase [Pirellulales bacterium]|nr:sulfatase [Pirellulales bacterium]